MAIFKGQGKSGVTGPTVQATVNKNKGDQGRNPAMTARGIVENGRIADGNAQMGSATPFYSPSDAKLPEYRGRPKQS